MATKRNSPGTYTDNGVRCTMNPPFDKATSPRATGPGIDGHNKAPFDKPQGMGNGSIPTRFFDEGMKAPNTVNAGMSGTAGVNLTAPMGKRRFSK